MRTAALRDERGLVGKIVILWLVFLAAFVLAAFDAGSESYMISSPARMRRPSTAQASQSSVTIAVVGTGTTAPGSAVATSQPPTCVDTSRTP